MPQSRKPWFGPKRFGWGVGPRSWQGWLVTAVLIGVIFAVRQFTIIH